MPESSPRNPSVVNLTLHSPEPVIEPASAWTEPSEWSKSARRSAREAWFPQLHPAMLIVISVLPFWLIPISHVISRPETATGFFHEELPYYIANGRAAFDRGNGLAYPNPYDPDPAAPAIYVHWLLWLLGVLPARLNVDPGDLVVGLTFLASLGFSAITWLLLKTRLAPAPVSPWVFLLAMWGGGILVAAGIVAGWMGLTDTQSTLLQFDPGRGLWFLNWGRNSLFLTESVYHILVAACWICEMRGQRLWGTMWCGLLAATHPWSGLELLLTLNLWRMLQLYGQRNRTAGMFCGASLAMLTLFLGYYRVWLPQFPHHLKLQQVWELNWSLSSGSAALAYIPVFIPAGVRILQALSATTRSALSDEVRGDRLLRSPVVPNDGVTHIPRAGSLNTAEQFLLCATAVATFLIFHDRWMKPVQPLHFTRGYLWMPLFLTGLPTLMQWFSLRNWIVRTGLVLLLSVDNLTFSAIHSRWQWQGTAGFHLNANDRAILRQLHQRFPGQLVLTQSESLNYLAPAYASVRPWIGHMFNTPDWESRKQTLATIFTEGRVAVPMIPAEIDILVVRRSFDDAGLKRSPDWTFIETQNGEWATWARVH